MHEENNMNILTDGLHIVFRPDARHGCYWLMDWGTFYESFHDLISARRGLEKERKRRKECTVVE